MSLESRSSLSTHIHDMPPELLSRIFLSYAISNDVLANLRWTKILLVCRRWHDIGIHTTELWTSIHVVCNDAYVPGPVSFTALHASRETSHQDAHARDVRRIELQRARAGWAVLDVQMDLYTKIPGIKLPYTVAFWNPESLRSLKLKGSSVYTSEILRAVALHPHRSLETLDVSKSFHSSQRGPLDSAEILDSVLKQCSSRLQHLIVRGIALSFPMIDGLRELSITIPFSQGSAQFHTQDMIAALTRCPLLERLQPHMLTQPTIADTTTASVSLPRLSSVLLTADSDVCGTILQRLKLPVTARVATSIRNVATTDMADATVSYISNHARKLDAPVIRGVSVERTLSTGGHLHMGMTGLLCLDTRRLFSHSASEDWSPPHYVGLWMSVLPRLSDNAYILLTNIARAFPFDSVAWLDLRVCSFLSSEDFWIEALSAMPAVQTVILHAGTKFTGAFIEILRNRLSLHGERPVANIVMDVGVAPGASHASNIAGSYDTFPKRARLNVIRALLYCADAARAGYALDTIEVVHDHPQTSRTQRSSYALMALRRELDWGELYQDLNEGFMYNGVLYGRAVGPQGVRRDTFAGIS